MQKLFLFFKSIKLAVVLLIFITVTSILATLIPQGKELAFYYHTYPQFVASLVVNLQLDNYFRSFLFIFSAILFFINLGVCAVDRLVREFTGRRKKRFGPDMIHIGLLILIVGSLVTFVARQEGSMYLAAGDEIKLPNGHMVRLESFEFLTYEDGKPKDWISTVDVFKGDELVVDSFPIEVNKPLRVGRIDLFQSSYAEEARVQFTDSSGRSMSISQGKPLETADAVYAFAGIFADSSAPDGTAAYFEKYVNRENAGTVRLIPGDELDGWVVASLGVFNVTGLQAVIDPGFVPVLIGLILAGLGLTITYLQKIGDKEI